MTIDLERFRKVRTLMDQGATPGERAAAKSRAETMASAAGMTLDEAIAEADIKPTPGPTFADFFKNDPYFRAQQEKHNKLDEMKRRDVLKRYGTMRAVFDPTPWEIALRKAIEPISLLMECKDPSGTDRLYTNILDGEIASDLTKGTERARAAIRSAFTWPKTLADALIEIRSWYHLHWERSLFSKYGWIENAEVQVRQTLVEDMLNNQGVQSWDDLQARFDWHHLRWTSQWLYPNEHERDDPFIDRLEFDFQTLRDLQHQSVRRTPSTLRKRGLADPDQADLFA